jgi:hypothetical protein
MKLFQLVPIIAQLKWQNGATPALMFDKKITTPVEGGYSFSVICRYNRSFHD